MDEQEKPFAVDRAKSGRAGCKKCKGKIEKSSLRLARVVPNRFGSEGSMAKMWYHVQCFFDALSKARATTRKIDSPEEDVDGWDQLTDEDRTEIEKHLEEVSSTSSSSPSKAKKTPTKKDSPIKNALETVKKPGDTTAAPAKTSTATCKKPGENNAAASNHHDDDDDKHKHRDHSFRQFRQICARLADTPAYTEKSALLREFFAKGSGGDGFQGDLYLWVRMLLPDVKKRVYNLQSKQIVKLFSRMLLCDQEEMMEDLNKGDVASTIKLFFEQSIHCQPHVRSVLTIQQVDAFLEDLAAVRTEDEQIYQFKNIVKKCTSNDLQMIIRLIKHDLRINARSAHILEGLHEDAKEAFQKSRDLDSVVTRVLELQRGADGNTRGTLSIGVSLMTPILPMLAEVCQSVDKAMSRCPNGMYSEVKYDGERVQLHKKGKEFKFFSRSLKPVVPHKVKHLEEYIPKAFPHGRDLILDSEVLLIDTMTNKPLPFGTLGVHKKAAFKHAKVCLFVFDCLYYNGEVLLDRCTSNDLQMIIRLIKHDLRINARSAHILEGLHEDAKEAFQKSRDLDSVVTRVLELQRGADGNTRGTLSIGVSLMTPILPMLAEVCQSVDKAMSRCPNGMYSEVKYDGERVQLHKKGKEFKFFSRSLKPVVPHKVKHLEEYIPKAFPHGRDLILDSEVLLIDTMTNKPLPFGTLGVHKKAAFKHAKVCLFVFDCLYYNGEVLLDRSMQERREILLSNMIEVPHHVVFSETKEIYDKRELEAMIARVLSEGLEGLVLKDLKSTYEPGKRHWLKIKKDYLCGGKMADTADLVPLGAWFGTGSKGRLHEIRVQCKLITSLLFCHKGGMMSVFLMCCWDPNTRKWLSVTKVHGGFDDKELQKLQTDLEMQRINKDLDKIPNWLKLTKTHVPDFIAKDPTKMPVWEITGAEFTKHDAHTAGISVRFPRVTRVRDDKTYKEATNLQELNVLFDNSRQGDAEELVSLLSSEVGSLTSIKPLQNFVRSPVKKESKKTSPIKTGSIDKFVKKIEKPIIKIESPTKKRPIESPPPPVDVKRPANHQPSAVTVKNKNVKKPLPDVFSKVHMVIPMWAAPSRHEQLVRYFIAYGGDLLNGKRSLAATHLLYDDTHPPRLQMTGVTWVTTSWLWDSIKMQTLQPVERYGPKT